MYYVELVLWVTFTVLSYIVTRAFLRMREDVDDLQTRMREKEYREITNPTPPSWKRGWGGEWYDANNTSRTVSSNKSERYKSGQKDDG